MKRITVIGTTLLALAIGIPAFGQWVPDPVIHNAVQLVGFSTATVTGDAGVLGMLDACHQDFPASRMCSSEEIVKTACQ